MVIERNRWARRLIVGQPVIAWPCSALLWFAGGALNLAVAVIVLWASALACVFGIVVPLKRQPGTACFAGQADDHVPW